MSEPGGFTDEEIALFREILPLFSLVSEIRLKNQLALTLLQILCRPARRRTDSGWSNDARKRRAGKCRNHDL